MKTLFFIFFTFTFSYCSAQSWQLSGFAVETSYASSTQSVSSYAKAVYLTVADNNGAPVTGLKTSNFTAWGQACNWVGRSCIFRPLEFVKPTEGIISFKEELPGLYIMTFEYSAGAKGGIPHIYVQVSTWSGGKGTIEGQVTKVTSPHAQILL
ncbi:hypothetical protein [Terrimonas alba]|uniref:hypothetical protein n=1 Tax=Terrimonas alba TaxID=3349636 RepID=UPI0035F47FF1